MSQLLDLSAVLANSCTEAANEAEALERVHAELMRVRTRNSQLQDEGTGVKERLMRQTDFIREVCDFVTVSRVSGLALPLVQEPPL